MKSKTTERTPAVKNNILYATRDALVHMLPYVSGRTVDLGAGTAKYKPLIQPHTTEYITFDLSPHSSIDVVGDIEATPFADNEFDTVVSTQVLEHVRRPWMVAQEIHRILKPGGILILTAPFLVQHHGHPDDYFRFTTSGITTLFEDQGFEIIESAGYGKTFSVLSEMLHFTFFNPYSKPLSRIKRKVLAIIQSTLRKLDTRSKSKTIYANVYVIAKKC